MRYVRFMSMSEFQRYLKGETLRNETKWREAGMRSDASGFCFFDDSVTPESRMDYLTGVVNMDVVVAFEKISNLPMKKTYATYRDPDRDTVDSIFEALFKPVTSMKVPEYSVPSYSMYTMRLTKVGMPMLLKGESNVVKAIDWIYRTE